MTNSEFFQLLERFASQPIPALSIRHLYLWQNRLDRLMTAMPPNLAAHMDMYALAATMVRRPNAFDEARRVIQSAIELWLHDYANDARQQQVVVVTGVSLLARYRVPLDRFAQAASDRRMIVFVLPASETAYQPPRPLPTCIQVNPAAQLGYFQATLNPTAIVGATGE